MSEAVFNRLVAIVENGTYSGSSLGAKALRTFADSIDPIAKPCVLILPRANTGWQRESSGHWQTNISYELHYYVQPISQQNQVVGIADASNLEILASKIFLARPQLQLFNVTALPPPDEVVGEISLSTISNLALPIPYPPSSVSSGQGASLYWGFIQRLVIPTRIYVDYLPLG